MIGISRVTLLFIIFLNYASTHPHVYQSRWVPVSATLWVIPSSSPMFFLITMHKQHFKTFFSPEGCLYEELGAKILHSPSETDCIYLKNTLNFFLSSPGWEGNVIERKTCDPRVTADPSYNIELKTSIESDSTIGLNRRLRTIDPLSLDSISNLNCTTRRDHRFIFSLDSIRSSSCPLIRVRVEKMEIREVAHQYHREYELRHLNEHDLATLEYGFLNSPGECPILKGVGGIVKYNSTHFVSFTTSAGTALQIADFWPDLLENQVVV